MNRTSHDQLMKGAIQDRFADFLRLFAPELAAELDLDAGVTFRNAETFTDLPQGALLVPDIVAEVRTLAGTPRLIVVHIEVQREREDEDFARRMWRYYIALMLREDKPILPIALLFYQTDEGVAWELHEEILFGRTIATFHYLQIGLARLAPRAEEYLQSGNVLAIALASIMGRPRRGARRAQLYFDCLRRLLDAAQARQVNEATLRLLGAVIDTYLPVNIEDRAALRVQLQQSGGDVMAIEATELTWREQVELTAMMRARREDIRELARRKFERVSPEVESLIEQAGSEDDLKALFGRAIDARTEADLLRQP